MLKSEVLLTSFISPHLNDVDPPFSPVMQYSQLNASFCCLFIYVQTSLSHYPLNTENPAQIN